MVKLKCTNQKCNHEWDYKGKSKFYVTCPHCYNKFKIILKNDQVLLKGGKNENENENKKFK